MRNLGYQAGAALPGFTVGLEVQTLHPETNERFTIPAGPEMVLQHYLPNIANFLNRVAIRPLAPLMESHEIDLAMLRLGVSRINDRKLAGAKMRRAVVI